MSDNPTRGFKDFIGWAFIGLAGLVLALVSLIYSTLSADIGNMNVRTQSHAERITATEERMISIKESLRRIETGVSELRKRQDETKK